MGENLTTMEVAKEIVRIDDNIDLIANNHNGLISCLNDNADIIDKNFDKLEKWTKILKSRTALNTLLIVGVIGYIVYKELKAKDEQ